MAFYVYGRNLNVIAFENDFSMISLTQAGKGLKKKVTTIFKDLTFTFNQRGQ